jgi:hypothetical protein
MFKIALLPLLAATGTIFLALPAFAECQRVVQNGNPNPARCVQRGTSYSKNLGGQAPVWHCFCN